MTTNTLPDSQLLDIKELVVQAENAFILFCGESDPVHDLTAWNKRKEGCYQAFRDLYRLSSTLVDEIVELRKDKERMDTLELPTTFVETEDVINVGLQWTVQFWQETGRCASGTGSTLREATDAALQAGGKNDLA